MRVNHLLRSLVLTLLLTPALAVAVNALEKQNLGIGD